MGLAWTSMGGAALYVESILENALNSASRPGLERTGNLKNIMKESTVIAYSFAKSVLARLFPGNKFFEKAKVHLHCPEGAVQRTAHRLALRWRHRYSRLLWTSLWTLR